MTDILFKLKILYWMLPYGLTYSSTFKEWKHDIWERNLDSFVCCGGTFYDECGCMGITIREQWSYSINKEHDND